MVGQLQIVNNLQIIIIKNIFKQYEQQQQLLLQYPLTKIFMDTLFNVEELYVVIIIIMMTVVSLMLLIWTLVTTPTTTTSTTKTIVYLLSLLTSSTSSFTATVFFLGFANLPYRFIRIWCFR